MERLTIDEVIEHCKRTTEKYENLNGINTLETTDISLSFIKEYWEHRQVKEYLEELKRYRDLEEQGLLLRLPCKVGDTVYRISDMFNVRSKYIEKTKISRIAIDEDEIYVFCSCKPNVKRIFGVHVFSTKEEAEQKLKEMESD